MKFKFPNKSDLGEIVEKFKKNLEGRKLGKIVSLSAAGSSLDVTIKKLGTSTLKFQSQTEGEDLILELENQKIALAHRKFKGEVLDKLVDVIETCGGNRIS